VGGVEERLGEEKHGSTLIVVKGLLSVVRVARTELEESVPKSR